MTARNPSRHDWIEQARSVKLEREIERRGIKLGAERWHERCGPCPRCGGDDRFSINTEKKLWNCRHCKEGGNVIDLVMFLDGVKLDAACTTLTGQQPPGRDENAAGASTAKRDTETRQAARQARADSEREATERERLQAERERLQRVKAARLWSKRRPIAGTPAERYLHQVRGITCRLPLTLAFLPALKSEHHPAMIAAFGIPDEPEPGVLGEPRAVNAVHLTLLRPDGSGKIERTREQPNKLIIGRPLGRPIVVAPPNDLLGLAITEGIEDALAVHQATGLGAWAAGSAMHMPALADAVPDYIEAITICADDDERGRDKTRELAEALHHRGSCEIRIEELPP